jgi:hypothetical protein
MSEWLKEHAWKACVGETLPWVRIPLSPPTSLLNAHSLASRTCPVWRDVLRCSIPPSPSFARRDRESRLAPDIAPAFACSIYTRKARDRTAGAIKNASAPAADPAELNFVVQRRELRGAGARRLADRPRYRVYVGLGEGTCCGDITVRNRSSASIGWWATNPR